VLGQLGQLRMARAARVRGHRGGRHLRRDERSDQRARRGAEDDIGVGRAEAGLRLEPFEGADEPRGADDAARSERESDPHLRGDPSEGRADGAPA
jgi:hypothetical protein